MPETGLLVSCEHAVNHVPDRWRDVFRGRDAILAGHRGYDPGAFELARTLADAFSAPLHASRISRLLVDHNRSPHHRGLWSEFSRGLPLADREALLADYYRPFRESVGDWLARHVGAGQSIVHLSVHSFTPVLDGKVRRVDIGLLYDPRRAAETRLAGRWKSALETLVPQLRVRRNAPYLGRNDAHQTTYRRLYCDSEYLGIEIEVNQALLVNQDAWEHVRSTIVASLCTAL